MDLKSYNPHCVDWGNCKIRVEDDCMGCNKNKRATSILINRIFNHIKVGLMGDQEWINLRKYSVMLLNDFVGDFLNNDDYCTFYTEDGCSYNKKKEPDCLNHYLEYFINNCLE